MSYTPERFMADSGITRDEVEAEKRRMLEEIRLYELKEARKAEHVTQKRLAQALGVSQKRISVIESGDVDHIKVDTLKRYLEGIAEHCTSPPPCPEARSCGSSETRIRRHPRLVGARRKIMKVPMPFRAHGPRPCRIGRGSFRA